VRTQAGALDRFWQLVNARDIDHAVELYQPQASVDLAGRISVGREAIAAELRSFIDAFPDIVYSPGRRLSGESSIVEEWTGRGTHTAMFMGRPPTGSKVSIHAVTIYDFDGALVASDRTYLDLSALLLRTGVVVMNDPSDAARG
jgi:predicted ester cyclase